VPHHEVLTCEVAVEGITGAVGIEPIDLDRGERPLDEEVGSDLVAVEGQGLLVLHRADAEIAVEQTGHQRLDHALGPAIPQRAPVEVGPKSAGAAATAAAELGQDHAQALDGDESLRECPFDALPHEVMREHRARVEQ
jgi:hypothetical protein